MLVVRSNGGWLQDMTEGEIAEAASKHHLAACTSEEETVLFTCPRFKDRDGRAAPRNAVLHYGHTAQGSRNPGDQQNLKGCCTGPGPFALRMVHVVNGECGSLNASAVLPSMLQTCTGLPCLPIPCIAWSTKAAWSMQLRIWSGRDRLSEHCNLLVR